MRRSNKRTCGTSFYDHVIKASKAQIVKAIGMPDYTDEIMEKVQNEWTCETDSGDVFTIYDWKEYRSYNDDEIIEWHIGGHSSQITKQAQNQIKTMYPLFGLQSI